MSIIKRCIALSLVFLLTMGIFTLPGYAKGSDVTVSFRAVNVTGEKNTLELSVFVEPKNGEAFKSVAAVLEVDSSILKVTPWLTMVPYDLSAASDWDSAAYVETKKADDTFSAGTIAYSKDGKTYLCISAEAYYPQQLDTEKCVATIRFLYAGDNTKDNVTMGTTIKLAEDNTVVYSSPAQHGIQYFTDTSTYYFNPLTEDENGDVVPDGTVTDDFLLLEEELFDELPIADGPSIAGGSSDPSKYASIVFYDWDNTLLGSITVPKGEDATEQVAEFENALKATTFDEGSQFYSSDTGKPLTNKKGYSFEGIWLDYNSDVRTHYGNALAPSNGAAMEIETPEGVSFTNVADNMTVKAAYKNNAECAVSGAATRYTTTAIGYNRFATTTNYSVKIRVQRESASGAGVVRISSPALRVVMTTDDNVRLYSLVTLENKDDVTVEISPNEKISTVECNVIDIYGITNWGTGAVARTSPQYVYKGVPANKTGFIYEGTLVSVNEAATPEGSTTNINASVLKNGLALDITNPSTGKNLTASNMRSYIKAAWNTKNSSQNNPGYIEGDPATYNNLTVEEMQYALHHEGAWVLQS